MKEILNETPINNNESRNTLFIRLSENFKWEFPCNS